MVGETNGAETPTRRQYLTYGGAVLAGGLLAGCAGGTEAQTGESPTDTATATETPTATATQAATDTATPAEQTTEQSTTGSAQPYSVSMAPVGEVTFEEVPETWVANNGSWADMGVALGLEPPKGV